MKKEEVKRTVIAKALKDAAFKAQLLKNPKAAIKAETGVEVMASQTVKVVEDSASVVHFVVPRVGTGERDETSAKDPKPENVKSDGGGDEEKTRAKLKADLAKNPGAAVEKATGVKVPAGATVKVLEDTSSLVHLVLPLR